VVVVLGIMQHILFILADLVVVVKVVQLSKLIELGYLIQAVEQVDILGTKHLHQEQQV
jgi:hypothetical protein